MDIYDIKSDFDQLVITFDILSKKIPFQYFYVKLSQIICEI